MDSKKINQLLQQIHDLVSKISLSKHNRLYSSVVFLDFAKAFDTVDHKILLSNLRHYGIRGTALKWFASYLSGREQSVFILETLSKTLSVKYGVPQGSVLGPILFLLYINDIVLASDIFEYTLFADDTSLFSQDINLKSLNEKINKGLVSVSQWLYANKLSLNVDKSNVILFKPPNAPDNVNFKVSLSDKKVKQESVVKYLGIRIDDKLNWNDQIAFVYTKILQGIGIICKLRFMLPLELLKNLYFCFCQSYVMYCLTVWGTKNSSLKTKLSNLLMRCVKKMTFSRNNCDIVQLCSTQNICNLNQLVIFETCKVCVQLSH